MNGLPHLRVSVWLRGALVALLLGCVLICAVGEYLAVKATQWDIRGEVKSRIKAGVPSEELVVVKILKKEPPREFIRRNAREFSYQGRMYDIVSQEERGDSIIYLCIFDERETALYANIEQQIKDQLAHNPERQQQQKELLQKIPKFYLLHTNPFIISFKCFSELHENRRHLLPALFLEVISPPPDAA